MVGIIIWAGLQLKSFLVSFFFIPAIPVSSGWLECRVTGIDIYAIIALNNDLCIIFDYQPAELKVG